MKKRKRDEESSPDQIKRSKDNESDDNSDGNEESRGPGRMTQMLALLQKMQGKISKFNIQINF
jgi:hypothetical protein